MNDGVRLLPGNGEYDATDEGESAELRKRIADLEEQLAMLRRAVSGMSGRPARKRERVAKV